MKLHFLLSLFIGILLISSCKDDQELGVYYYPVDELMGGMNAAKVYQYKCLSDSLLSDEYWMVRGFEKEGNRFLSFMNYGPHFNILQITTEKIDADYAVLQEQILHDYDTIGRMTMNKAIIEKAQLFPFTVKDTSDFVEMNLRFIDPTDSLQEMSFFRKRQFGGFLDYEFKGKQLACAVFDTKENYLIDHQDKESNLDYNGVMVEYFAAGIGLIYFKKTIQKSISFEYGLENIYSMDEFKKLFRESIKDDPLHFTTRKRPGK